ncbi:MAG: hypothetical protein AMXMBFR48_23910 [Ignavibacteriales bacterium]
MTFKEIKELRVSGKLEEALVLGFQELQKNPGDIWIKRGIAWVYYDYLKKYCAEGNFTDFKIILKKIHDLNLPEEETMFFDQCAWQIGKFVFSVASEQPPDYSKISDIYLSIKFFHFSKPSESYSFLFKSFLKMNRDWKQWFDFVKWWNIENLLPEDYLKTSYNEKLIMSVAEQGYIAYSKKLLDNDDYRDQYAINRKEEIRVFLSLLDNLIKDHPEYTYPPYYKAKLLIALGEGDQSFNALLPFARQKKNDFWVWHLFSELFQNDKELQFSCYCKALSLNAGDEFLIKVREEFAQILIHDKFYNEAKWEVNNIIHTRTKNGWKIQGNLAGWVVQDWYETASLPENNVQFYSKHLKRAEEVLYSDIPEEIIVIEFVNTEKKVASFIKDREKHGYFKYAGVIQNPRIGEQFKVRFDGEGKESFFRVIFAEKTTINNDSDLIKDFSGKIKIIAQKNIGFVENIFIDSKLILSNNLQDGHRVAGKAILSFNKNKNEWGWKAFEIKINL